MAYIIKSAAVGVAEPVSALAKSQDFGRMRDVYILASKYRNRDMVRLWSDFQAEQPKMAELVIRDVVNDRRQAAAANQELDGRLREAERLVTKAKKPKKALKALKADGTLTKIGRRYAAEAEALVAANAVSWLTSEHPEFREAAEGYLAKHAPRGLDELGEARALLADPVLGISDPVHREWAYEAALRRD